MAPRLESGPLSAVLSDTLVRVFAEYTGRGPTKVRTYLADDLVVCLLGDALNKAERKLIDDGEERTVVSIQRLYQHAMREAMSDAVADVTGQKVVAFFSDTHIDPAMACEIFVLAPRAKTAA
jgi:uncharacterized protein YbcI